MAISSHRGIPATCLHSYGRFFDFCKSMIESTSSRAFYKGVEYSAYMTNRQGEVPLSGDKFGRHSG